MERQQLRGLSLTPRLGPSVRFRNAAQSTLRLGKNTLGAMGERPPIKGAAGKRAVPTDDGQERSVACLTVAHVLAMPATHAVTVSRLSPTAE